MPTMPVILDQVPTDELVAEINRRAAKAKLEKEKEQDARKNKYWKLFGELDAKVTVRDVINVLAPSHGRTSCSDAERQNGFSGGDIPRCTRCGLLDIYGLEPEIFIEVSFRKDS